jgi:hypothetical protein
MVLVSLCHRLQQELLKCSLWQVEGLLDKYRSSATNTILDTATIFSSDKEGRITLIAVK